MSAAEQAAAAAVVAGVVELAKLAPELVGIIKRGLAGADDTAPVVPKLREAMTAPELTELYETVERLKRKKRGGA